MKLIFSIIIPILIAIIFLNGQPWWFDYAFSIPKYNGLECYKAAGPSSKECRSGYCLPAPHTKKDGSKKYFCTSESMNCSLPFTDGAKFKTEVFLNGTKLTCGSPKEGGWAQFISPQRLK